MADSRRMLTSDDVNQATRALKSLCESYKDQVSQQGLKNFQLVYNANTNSFEVDIFIKTSSNAFTEMLKKWGMTTSRSWLASHERDSYPVRFSIKQELMFSLPAFCREASIRDPSQ